MFLSLGLSKDHGTNLYNWQWETLQSHVAYAGVTNLGVGFFQRVNRVGSKPREMQLEMMEPLEEHLLHFWF